MPKRQGKVLYSQRAIQARIKQLAAGIRRHYKGKPLTVIGLMNGSVFFLVDLLRQLPEETHVECWTIASYAGTKSTGTVRGLDAYTRGFRGRNVLIIDDILDTGRTLHAVRAHVKKLGADDIRICVLLSKLRPRERAVTADWSGFDMEDRFVIGYGLDLDQQFRAMPMIRTLD
jgi:hypoxanthine phosphoribosyltransferase